MWLGEPMRRTITIEVEQVMPEAHPELLSKAIRTRGYAGNRQALLKVCARIWRRQLAESTRARGAALSGKA